MTTEVKEKQIIPPKKSKSIWLSLIFIAIALLCISTVISLNKNFSLNDFILYIKNANIYFLLLALICTILYIFCEGFAINTICKSFNYKNKKIDGFFYASADIYFSAITPSATGGQPASAYFMIKDKMPSSVVTATLLFNLLMYTLSLFIVSLVTFVLCLPIFLKFSTISQIFIIIGFLVQITLVVIFSFLLFNAKFLYNICAFVLNILFKLHLIKNVQEKLDKLTKTMEKYHEHALLLKDKKTVLAKVLLINIGQRIALFLIPILIYLAGHGSLGNIFAIWAVQNMVTIGANFIPIPGAMGITDYLMLDGFSKIMDINAASSLELLTRVFSFYSCAIICGIAVLIKYWLIRRSRKNDRVL